MVVDELEPRQKLLLRAVIVEYIGGAEPVASEHLASKYDLGVKSATVRNELAHMAYLGYLEQPHTSAGRIPSDKGYRYFVDHLAISRAPGTDERQSVQSAAIEGELLEGLLRETTKALSRLTHLLSAAALVRDAKLTVKSAMITALGPHQALLLLVLSNGHAESRLVDCPSGVTLDDLGKANEALKQSAVGNNLRSLIKAKAPALEGDSPLEQLLTAIWNPLRTAARELTRGNLLTEGEEFLFGQPEFRHDAETLSSLLDTLKSGDILFEAITSPDASGTVTIGKENRSEKMHRLSVVKHSFYVGESEAGTIAIVGPTRMAYESGMPLVNFTARALTDALTRFFC